MIMLQDMHIMHSPKMERDPDVCDKKTSDRKKLFFRLLVDGPCIACHIIPGTFAAQAFEIRIRIDTEKSTHGTISSCRPERNKMGTLLIDGIRESLGQT